MTAPPSASGALLATPRHAYLDALRVMATFLLIIFHGGLIFTPFHHYVIENAEKSLVIGVFAAAFLHLWHMPLFFLLAGAAAWFALGRRGSGAFAAERFRRIFLPLLFGFFLLVPPQVYWDLVSRGFFSGTYLEFYSWYFSEGVRYITYHHLWFLVYLFSLTLVLLPLLAFLRSVRGTPVLHRLADTLSRPGLIFLPGGLMALTETIFRGGWPGWYNLVDDWANVTLFAQCILWGFVLVSDPRLIETIRRQWRLALAVAVAITTVLLWVVWTTGERPQPGYTDPLYGLYTVAVGVNTWCWLVGWLGLGYTVLNRPGIWLDRASEISYPFYILHHTILIGVGFYVIQTPLGIWPKFLITCIATLALTLLACWLARLTPLTRFLVGMKPRPQAAKP